LNKVPLTFVIDGMLAYYSSKYPCDSIQRIYEILKAVFPVVTVKMLTKSRHKYSRPGGRNNSLHDCVRRMLDAAKLVYSEEGFNERWRHTS
ncbi:MAG TPA: hypothetical protein VMS08_02790, partial [Candidatus Saccharimonadia bacterium]|nr:hypothetical protein [Candidatus Saccharimonadia bacterium]